MKLEQYKQTLNVENLERKDKNRNKKNYLRKRAEWICKKKEGRVKKVEEIRHRGRKERKGQRNMEITRRTKDSRASIFLFF